MSTSCAPSAHVRRLHAGHHERRRTQHAAVVPGMVPGLRACVVFIQDAMRVTSDVTDTDERLHNGDFTRRLDHESAWNRVSCGGNAPYFVERSRGRSAPSRVSWGCAPASANPHNGHTGPTADHAGPHHTTAHTLAVASQPYAPHRRKRVHQRVCAPETCHARGRACGRRYGEIASVLSFYGFI